MCPVGWEYATRIDAESPCYTDRPGATGLGGASQRTGESLQRREPPNGWVRSRSDVWEGWTPPNWTPRLQGWKIHVSATQDDAAAILDAVTRICLDAGVAFKYLPTLTELWAANVKHADRASAGKFITVYPADDHQLAALLDRLVEALAEHDGPYVLSDLRVGDAPVFVRYGGIYPLAYRDEDDTSISALATGPALTLVEDRRQPSFVIPQGVALPECLHDAWHRHQRDVASPIDRYARIEALGFSNAGGVYLATLPDGARHVLKEARPHAGLDAIGRDALERQRHEERVLTDLRGCPGVQQLVTSFTAWEHRFLALEYLEGMPLVKWAAANYPLHYVSREDDPQVIASYRTRAMGIVDQLTGIIERVHARGWCVGDLHPGNVLIDDEATVALLDVEDATPIDAPRQIGMRVIEYCAPDGFGAREADWYAAARIAMNLYVTGWPVEIIRPDAWEGSLDLVRERLGEQPAAQIEALCARAGETPGRGAVRHTLSPRIVAGPPPARPAAIGAVVDGLVDFTDWSTRFVPTGRYPGDPVLGGRLPWASWEAGLAGIVFARARIGRPVAEEVARRLVTVSEVLEHDGPLGLHHGLAGMALALHEQGHDARAVALLRACLGRVEQLRRRDLAHGRAGVLLAALEVACATGDDRLRDDALRLYERFADQDPPPGAGKAGLHFGESGIAVLDLMVAHHTDDHQALDRAVWRIRHDAQGCELTPQGPCLVTDAEGGRLLPYLEWGSAGVWAAANIAACLTGVPLLDDAHTRGIRHACSSRMYVYDGFHHGRAGILAALLTAGEAGATAADFQAGYLAANLPSIEGHRCVVGDGLVRLSADLATGAAGVALVLDCAATARPFGWLPIARSSANALADRLRPARPDAPRNGPGRVAHASSALAVPT